MGDGARFEHLKGSIPVKLKPIATSFQAPQSGCDDTCSFVSITFDSAGIGSLIFWLVGTAKFTSCPVG